MLVHIGVYIGLRHEITKTCSINRKHRSKLNSNLKGGIYPHYSGLKEYFRPPSPAILGVMEEACAGLAQSAKSLTMGLIKKG